MFVSAGKDSNGLNLYYRLCGTVCAENFHQKMDTAIGTWHIGARTAHNLLVLLAFRYNVTTMINRCGAYNFGHYELNLVDRIQNIFKSYTMF